MIQKIKTLLLIAFLICTSCIIIGLYPIAAEAVSNKGAWEYFDDGTKICMGIGEDCDLPEAGKLFDTGGNGGY